MKTITKLLLPLVFILCEQASNAQPWLQSPYLLLDNNTVESSNLSFYDIQSAFQQYEKTHTTIDGENVVKFKGYKPFKRWENYMAPRVYPSGDISLAGKKYEEFMKYLDSPYYIYSSAKNSSAQSLSGNWVSLGPTGSNFLSYWGGAARTNFLRIDPTNSNNMWLGSPTGGLWKTTDAGQNWTTNTDFLTMVGCSDLAIAPTNTNIMYLATGDADGISSQLTIPSIGVYKSTDGGQTWFPTTGLAWQRSWNRVIYKLLVHPTNPNIVYAATSVGIFKTSDGGINWPSVVGGYFCDIEFKPGNPNVLYATSGWTNSGTFYRSINAGANWTAISAGLPAPANVGRMGIAVTPADSNKVYLVASATNSTFYGFYVSGDGGTSFSLRSNSPNILSTITPGQAWYDLAVAVSPIDTAKVLVGGMVLYVSTNGGYNWTLNGSSNNVGAPFVHSDHHDIQFFPGSSSTYFSANDGGIWKTTNNGTNWTTINGGLQISQMYKMGTSASNPYKILVGLQDMGHHLLQTNSWSLFALGTGDGMEQIISPSNDSIMYLMGNSGRLIRTINHGQNYSIIANSNGVGVNAASSWITPVTLHPTNDSILLIGKAQVYRTFNRGTSWAQVGNVTGGATNLIALAYAPSNPNYIYAAKTNRLFVSTDGNNFTDRTGILPVGAAQITSLVVSHSNPQHIWVTFSGYSAVNKVWYSPDAGLTWVNNSTGLPNLPVNCIEYQKNSSNGLYAGTDVGVYFKSDSLAAWVPFFTNLPNTDVQELEINYTINKIRAATNGRGLWESDLATPIPSFSVSAACVGNPITFTDLSQGNPTGWSWLFPGGNPASSNSQNPTITYNSPGTYTVTLYSANINGSSYTTQTIVVNPTPTANAGSNVSICQGGNTTLTGSGGGTYLWVPSTGLSANNIANPVANPTVTTTYTLTVTTNGCSATASVTVTVDPNPAIPTISQNGNILTSTSATTYQWYLNSNPINGETQQNYTITQNGSYTVCVTNNFGCSACSAPFNAMVTGLDDEINGLVISIFPNPNNGVFDLMMNISTTDNYVIEITNAIGQTICKNELQNYSGNYSKHFDITTKGKGSYTLTIKNTNNQTVKRVIVF